MTDFMFNRALASLLFSMLLVSCAHSGKITQASCADVGVRDDLEGRTLEKLQALAIHCARSESRQELEAVSRIARHIERAFSKAERAEFAKRIRLFESALQIQSGTAPGEYVVAPPVTPPVRFHYTDRMIDALLSLDVNRVLAQERELRNAVYEQEATHLASPSEALQTPYAYFDAIFKALSPQAGSRFVDIGSGFGRMGLFIALEHPGMSFTGFELVRERVEEAKHAAGLFGVGNRAAFVEQNLAAKDFALPEADFYFMNNPATDATLTKIWSDLKAIAKRHDFKVITVFLDKKKIAPWLKPAGSIYIGPNPANTLLIWSPKP